MKNSTKIALLCIITVCIATIIIPVYRKRRDESIIQEETAKMREVLDQYEAIMPTKLAERCEKAGFEIEGRYTVNIPGSVEPSVRQQRATLPG